jgi:hypothetical protein
MEQLCSQWKDLHESDICVFFKKISRENSSFIKIGKNSDQELKTNINVYTSQPVLGVRNASDRSRREN